MKYKPIPRNMSSRSRNAPRNMSSRSRSTSPLHAGVRRQNLQHIRIEQWVRRESEQPVVQVSIEAVSGTDSIQPQQQPAAHESIDIASDDDPCPTTQRSIVLDDWSMSNAIDSVQCPTTCSQTLSDTSENVAALESSKTSGDAGDPRREGRRSLLFVDSAQKARVENRGCIAHLHPQLRPAPRHTHQGTTP